MAARGVHTSGPSSGSQALNSMIIQFQTKLKSNESVISSNRKTIASLESENASLRKDNASLKETISSLIKELEQTKVTYGKERRNQGDSEFKPKSMSTYAGGPHNIDNSKLSPALSSPSDVTGNSGAGFIPGRNREGVPFCAEIFEGKLSHGPNVKLMFVNLASKIGEKLAQLGDVQGRESNLKKQIENWQVTSKYLLQFFVILQAIAINSGNECSAWLDVALENESNQSIRQHIWKMWRLLQWNIHHTLKNNKKCSPRTQVKIDEWFTLQNDALEIPDNIELTVANLLKSMSRDFGVAKEEVVEGLSMSIPMEPEEESSGISSSDSSLSSTIPAEDLWTFKSILQSLVENIEDLYQKHALLGKSSVLDGLDELERDMYLPQREALENYDLGNLLRLMSSVIQSLGEEVTSINAEKGHCQRCGHDINSDVKGDKSNESALHSQKTQGLPKGLVSAGPSSGLKTLQSRETANQMQGSMFPRIPNLMMTGGAMPNVPNAVWPLHGKYQGNHGPLPPRQLTDLQNTNPYVRSKSDTSLSPQQRKVADQLLLSKPSSLDSVFKRKSSPISISTSPPPVLYSPQLGEHLSDSDDEFQVCGPPDTPPEVRSIERMQIGRDSIERLTESSGRKDRLGAFSKYAGQSAYQPRDNGALFDRRLPLSQVHQCTGDNSGTTQDIVLPSSVQWSTVQLKDGGMASPTLGAMSQFHTAQQRSQHMNYFSTIPQDSYLNTYTDDVERDGLDTLTNIPKASFELGRREPCPVCKVTFPDYVPMQAIQSHINLHFDENPGSFEVISESYNSLNK